MYRADCPRPPDHRLRSGPPARLIAIAFSFLLHGAILGGLYWLSESPPAQPHAVIAVELVVSRAGTAPSSGIENSGVQRSGIASLGANWAIPEVEETIHVDQATNTPARSQTSTKPPVTLSMAQNVVAVRPRPRIKPRPPKRPAQPELQEKIARFPRDLVKKIAPAPIHQTVALPTGELERAIDDLKQNGSDRTADENAALRLAHAVPGGDLSTAEAGIETGPKFGNREIANPAPRYPHRARRQGQEGRVVLRVRVSAAGGAADVAVRNSSGHRLLDAAAVEVVQRWRFIPAQRLGVPVPGVVDVPITFRLTN